jgi:siroheme synthase
VTGHCKGETDKVDWQALARPGQTVVFYMGLGHLANILARLIEHGVPATRAAAVVEQATQATQRVVTGTVSDLAGRVGAAGIEPPALLIVGEVARLHETLHWFNATQANGNEPFVLTQNSSGRLRA